ncbi:hypothetical protein ACWGKW_12135 [Streptomyces sp. NPDC054766]
MPTPAPPWASCAWLSPSYARRRCLPLALGLVVPLGMPWGVAVIRYTATEEVRE